MGKYKLRGIALSLIFSFFLTGVVPAYAMPIAQEQKSELVASTEERDQAVQAAVDTPTMLQEVAEQVNSAAIQGAIPIPETSPSPAPSPNGVAEEDSVSNYGAPGILAMPPVADPVTTPSYMPTMPPVAEPVVVPSDIPTMPPAAEPVVVPTDMPTAPPAEEPVVVPTDVPSDDIDDPSEDPEDPEDPNQAAITALEDAGIVPAGVNDDGEPEYTQAQIDLAQAILDANHTVSQQLMDIAGLLEDHEVPVTEATLDAAQTLIDLGVSSTIMPGAFAEAVTAIAADPGGDPTQIAFEIFFEWSGIGTMPWTDDPEIGSVNCQMFGNLTTIIMQAMGFNVQTLGINFDVEGSIYTGHVINVVYDGDGNLMGIWEPNPGQWVVMANPGDTLDDLLATEEFSDYLQQFGNGEDPVVLNEEDPYETWVMPSFAGTAVDWFNEDYFFWVIENYLNGDVQGIIDDMYPFFGLAPPPPVMPPADDPTDGGTDPVMPPVMPPVVDPVPDPSDLPTMPPVMDPVPPPTDIPVIDPAPVPSDFPSPVPTPVMPPVVDPVPIPADPIPDPSDIPTMPPVVDPIPVPSDIPVIDPIPVPSDIPVMPPAPADVWTPPAPMPPMPMPEPSPAGIGFDMYANPVYVWPAPYVWFDPYDLDHDGIPDYIMQVAVI